ncbi:amidase family protein [Corynebacterium variabile]|uniref:amidase family protein n=1 Tax=Corynebacterium variabile TaxID=1727 RepID=UPI001D845E1D|nr:amidase [Corynebacterium variabile]HJG46116.1 amidase [Corynebacterium variabile]
MGTPGTPTTTAARLAAATAATGLSAAELGVARMYDTPHTSGCAETTGTLREVEVLVKDLQRVAGETTGFGSPAHEEVADEHDSTVRSLLATGASLVGASVTAEYGATVYTEPDLVGGGPGPVNPVDARMTTGGSSSGAAVAVARGIVDIAHANDGGGSIRVPAAAVGLPGMKPAHRVFGSGALPNPAAQGFIARDLALTARAYDLASTTPVRPGLRLGMSTVPFHGDPGQAGPTAVDPRIATATTASAALLVNHPQVSGVVPVDAPYPVERFAVFSRIMAARCAGLPDPLGPMPGWLKEQGRALAASDIEDAAASLRVLPGDIERAWPEVDVVVTPTLACAPPPVGAFSSLALAGSHRLDFLAQTAWTPWATLWNLTGWAALSVPLVAPAPGQWPVSVHLGAVGDRVDAATLLALGAHLQDAVARMIGSGDADVSGFTVPEPGNIESLRYRPVVAGHGHSHGDGHSHAH